jgi:hypothetical protein
MNWLKLKGFIWGREVGFWLARLGMKLVRRFPHPGADEAVRKTAGMESHPEAIKATSLELAKPYTSYSGVDIRIYLDGEVVGTAQALSQEARDQYCCGTLISLVLDRVQFNPGDKFKEMVVIAANEYGRAACLVWATEVEFISSQIGFTVDDIVVEQRLDWCGRYHDPNAVDAVKFLQERRKR